MQEETSLKIFSEIRTIHWRKCQYLEIDIGDALVTLFHSESFVRFNENIRGAGIFIQSTSPTNQHMIEFSQLMRPKSLSGPCNGSPSFFGYARQDRKDQTLFITSKLVANLLVLWQNVFLHGSAAQQIQGFFDAPLITCTHPRLFEDLKNRDPDNMTIFSPRRGGMKMAALFGRLGCRLVLSPSEGRVPPVEAMNGR